MPRLRSIPGVRQPELHLNPRARARNSDLSRRRQGQRGGVGKGSVVEPRFGGKSSKRRSLHFPRTALHKRGGVAGRYSTRLRNVSLSGLHPDAWRNPTDEHPPHAGHGGRTLRPLQPRGRGARRLPAPLCLRPGRRAARRHGARRHRGPGRGLLAEHRRHPRGRRDGPRRSGEDHHLPGAAGGRGRGRRGAGKAFRRRTTRRTGTSIIFTRSTGTRRRWRRIGSAGAAAEDDDRIGLTAFARHRRRYSGRSPSWRAASTETARPARFPPVGRAGRTGCS